MPLVISHNSARPVANLGYRTLVHCSTLRCEGGGHPDSGGPEGRRVTAKVAMSGNIVGGPTAGRAGCEACGDLVRPPFAGWQGSVKQEPMVVPRSGTDRNLLPSVRRGRQYVQQPYGPVGSVREPADGPGWTRRGTSRSPSPSRRPRPRSPPATRSCSSPRRSRPRPRCGSPSSSKGCSPRACSRSFRAGPTRVWRSWTVPTSSPSPGPQPSAGPSSRPPPGAVRPYRPRWAARTPRSCCPTPMWRPTPSPTAWSPPCTPPTSTRPCAAPTGSPPAW